MRLKSLTLAPENFKIAFRGKALSDGCWRAHTCPCKQMSPWYWHRLTNRIPKTAHLQPPSLPERSCKVWVSARVHCTPQVTPLARRRAALRALGRNGVTPRVGGSYLRGSAALRARAARGECRGGQPRGSELARSGSGCSGRRRRRRKGGKGGGEGGRRRWLREALGLSLALQAE